MKVYAYISRGIVAQIISTEHDIKEQFSPEFVANCVDVTEISPQPEENWVATQIDSAWKFGPPA